MPPGKGSAEQDIRFRRLESFSDGIFAVAMTLLVFSFPLSRLPSNLGQAQIEGVIISLGRQFQTFIISFLAVRAFWMAHHDVFDRITRHDRPLVWINFVFCCATSSFHFPRPLWWTTACTGSPSASTQYLSQQQGLCLPCSGSTSLVVTA